MEAVRFEVRGRVQGVGYRAFVWRSARDLKLRGWVRNRADAAVEVAALGAPDKINILERQLHAGPPLARVHSVTRLPGLPPFPRLSPHGFDIADDA